MGPPSAPMGTPYTEHTFMLPQQHFSELDSVAFESGGVLSSTDFAQFRSQNQAQSYASMSHSGAHSVFSLASGDFAGFSGGFAGAAGPASLQGGLSSSSNVQGSIQEGPSSTDLTGWLPSTPSAQGDVL